MRRLETADEEIRSLLSDHNLWGSQLASMVAVNARLASCPVDSASDATVGGHSRGGRSPRQPTVQAPQTPMTNWGSPYDYE